MRKMIALFVAAAALGELLSWLQVPVAWLLGPMLVGIGAAARWGSQRDWPAGFMTAGQMIVGISSGISFPLGALSLAGSHAVPLALAALITGAVSVLNGYLLHRWGAIDRATSFLATLPGAASTMVAMSDGMGVDPVAVAVLQYLRQLLVVFLAPLAVHSLFPAGAGDGGGVAAAPELSWPELLVGLLVLTACGLVGIWAGPRARLPAPTFLGPFFVALLASWLVPLQLVLPPALLAAGLLCIGLTIGIRFDLHGARKLGKVALLEALLVLALIAFCLGVGYVFHLVTGVDPMTAALGSTPGGMDVMVATATQLRANAALVLAMQMVRWFSVLLVGPWLMARLAGGARRAA